jgi:hypothetical protein
MLFPLLVVCRIKLLNPHYLQCRICSSIVKEGNNTHDKYSLMAIVAKLPSLLPSAVKSNVTFSRT